MSATVSAPGLFVEAYPLDGKPALVTHVQAVVPKADGSLCYLVDGLNGADPGRIVTLDPATGVLAVLFDESSGMPGGMQAGCLSSDEAVLYVGTVAGALYSIVLATGVVSLVADLSGSIPQITQLLLDPENVRRLLVLCPYASKGSDIQAFDLDSAVLAPLGVQCFNSFMDAVPGLLLTQRENGGYHTAGPILRYLRAFGVRSEVVAGYYAAGVGDGPAFTTPIGSHAGIATDDGRTNIYFSTGGGGGLKVVAAGAITTIDAGMSDRALAMVRAVNKLVAFDGHQLYIFS